MVVELQQVQKEHGNIFVLAREVAKLLSMSHATLVTVKLEHPKEIDPTWLEALDWKVKIYDDYIDELIKHRGVTLMTWLRLKIILMLWKFI